MKFVLSLAHHDISIYGGGERIPDGEIFIKRNAICLTRKNGELSTESVISKPFFLFADNTSDKEDFYFAMLRSQERNSDIPNGPPATLQFDIKDMVALVQRLHSSEEHMQTRWFNAIIGRVFLSLYKTSDVENFVRSKIEKKISRVKKPSFLSGIAVRNVDMGSGAPYITNPRLKDLTVDGDCVVEADVSYSGNFRLEVAATAKIEFGTRFNRAVNLLLAVVLQKVEGHVLLRIKPPPSNRVWFTFQTAPKIEMSVQPIVSSRQITYTMILRHIENRIKEVVAESIVLPYWDDIAFSSTENKKWRGGVWADDTSRHAPRDLEAVAEDGDDEIEPLESESQSDSAMPLAPTSIPVEPLQSTTFPRKTTKSLFNLAYSNATASSTSVDTTKSDKPRAIRQGSFTSASTPVVRTDVTNVDAFKLATPPEHSHAASVMTAISVKSQSTSPAQTPQGSPSKPSGFGKPRSHSSASSRSDKGLHEQQSVQPGNETTGDIQAESRVYRGPTTTNIRPHDAKETSRHSLRQESTSSSDSTPSYGQGSTTEKYLIDQPLHQNPASSFSKPSKLENQSVPVKRLSSTVANAAATARRWGLNALQRNHDQNRDVSLDYDGKDLSQPMGRGRPLPPPGIPLPPPDRKKPTTPIPVPKRKSLPPPVLPPRPAKASSYEDTYMSDPPSPVDNGNKDARNTLPSESLSSLPGSVPEGMEIADSQSRRDADQNATLVDDGIFVVAAPLTSEPTTPSETKVTYLPPWVDDEVDSLVK